MDNLILPIIMIPSSLLFTCIGIYAWKRKKPMWFWAGDTVCEEDITDVRAYNHANGMMWIVFSLPLWIGTIVGLNDMKMGGNIILFDSTIGLLLLILTYINIYKKYKKS